MSEILSIKTEILDTIKRLDGIVAAYSGQIADPSMGRLQKAILTAKGIEVLRSILDEKTMRPFMSLMNSPIGFKTDRGPNQKAEKNRTPYTVEEVREVLIAAFLSGVYPFNNELNIIAANLYVAKNGYRRKVLEFPGLAGAEVISGGVYAREGKTFIRMMGRWKLHGKVGELRDQEGKLGRVFAIPTNEWTGDDAVIGKAERRAWKAIWECITGSEIVGDSDEDDSLVPDQSGGVGAEIKPGPDKTKTEILAADLAKKMKREPVQQTQVEEPIAAGAKDDF